MTYFLIAISAIFVNNIVLTQFLGICPFLGVSNRVSTALGMSAAVAFVMTLATLVSYLIQIWILDFFGIQFMQTIFFILVIATLVQTVELVLKKVSPALYQSLGVFLPLITTNCAILGVAILVLKGDEPMPLEEALVFAVSSSIGFGLALTIFAGLREKLELMDIPKALKGTPISLITAGLLSLAFAGFAGMVKI
jgi:electron transport complex protein RnfA